MKKLTIILFTFICLIAVSTSANASTFKDIPASHSLKIEIDYLVERNIISGYPDKTFKPNALISKKHIAAMLVKALDLPTTNVKNPQYIDVPTSHPYYKEIAAAYTAGIFGEAKYFKPDSNISRAFMAKILSQAFNLQPIEDNKKTFKDVPKNHSLQKYIQLVSMNNVANGTTQEDTYGYPSYSFNPNKLLTRAHFSAFLARAMSLQTDDYLPNPDYMYVNTDVTSEYNGSYLQFLKFDSEYGENATIWELNLFKSDEIIEQSNLVYGINDGYYYLGYPESEGIYAVSFPFTIGLKYDTLSEDEYQGRQEIIETDTTVRILGEFIDNVIAVKHTSIDWLYINGENYKNGFTHEYMYIAKNRGIVGFSDELYEDIEPFYTTQLPY